MEKSISSCQWQSLYLLLRLVTWTFLNYYLWIPKYQHRQEPQRTAQTLKKKSADNFLSFCHPAGGRRSTQTVNYRVTGCSAPWECLICLCTTQGVSSCSKCHFSLSWKERSWMSQCLIFMGHNKGIQETQQCLLHLEVVSWGDRPADSRWGQLGHWLVYLHLFTGCVHSSFSTFLRLTLNTVSWEFQETLFWHAKNALKKIISTSLVKLFCLKVLIWLLRCPPGNELWSSFLILIME